MIRHIAMLSMFLVVAPASAYAEGRSVIGVLEDPQCKQTTETLVRVLFGHSGTGWKALDNARKATDYLSREMRWVIARRGGTMGELTTIDYDSSVKDSWAYTRDRLLRIEAGQSPPLLPNDNHEFSGWCDPPVHRPLVVVHHGGFIDPDKWAEADSLPGDITLAMALFEEKVGPAFKCKADTGERVQFSYGQNDIEILQSFRDRSGRRVITLRLRDPAEAEMCDGPIDLSFDTHLFLISDRVSYLGSGLALVDMGDYDGDGSTEGLFWFSGYNLDGYVLLWANFTSRSEYLWKYH